MRWQLEITTSTSTEIKAWQHNNTHQKEIQIRQYNLH